MSGKLKFMTHRRVPVFCDGKGGNSEAGMPKRNIKASQTAGGSGRGTLTSDIASEYDVPSKFEYLL